MPGKRDWNLLRERIIGLGEESARKSFYPELQQRMLQLEETRESLRVSQENLWSVFNSVHDAIFIHDRQGRILEVNQSAAAMYGVPRESLRGLTVMDISAMDLDPIDSLAHIQSLFARMDQQGFVVFDWKAKRPGDGSLVEVEVALRPATWYGEPVVAAVVRDITERKLAERLLSEAQKLDSLGQLAGGLAHDTNNMLSVILGYSELLLEDPALADEGARGHLGLIRQAALHSADLTRQLLAFARKQMIQPQRTDLNGLVEETQRMLRRLIGENHSLVWKPATSLWHVWIDPSQVNQVLVNLVVNARDAIETSGTITLETCNLRVDEAYAKAHPEAEPGSYAVLSVADSGRGMAPAVLGHIFEPFFTTKEVGKGTGLGLAMVYGIIRQNGGFITVSSAPGAGSTFRLHLPRFLDSGTAGAAPAEPEEARRGTETVLLVEDEEPLLGLGRTILEGAGYRVLALADPREALALAAREPGEIHLLATDMVLPGMNGVALYLEIRKLRPGIRRFYLSGYAPEALSAAGALETAGRFLQKPYSRHSLLRMVRTVLDGPD